MNRFKSMCIAVAFLVGCGFGGRVSAECRGAENHPHPSLFRGNIISADTKLLLISMGPQGGSIDVAGKSCRIDPTASNEKVMVVMCGDRRLAWVPASLTTCQTWEGPHWRTYEFVISAVARDGDVKMFNLLTAPESQGKTAVTIPKNSGLGAAPIFAKRKWLGSGPVRLFEWVSVPMSHHVPFYKAPADGSSRAGFCQLDETNRGFSPIGKLKGDWIAVRCQKPSGKAKMGWVRWKSASGGWILYTAHQ